MRPIAPWTNPVAVSGSLRTGVPSLRRWFRRMGWPWVIAVAVVSPRAFAQSTPDGGGVSEPHIQPPTAILRPTVVYPPGADGRRVDVELVVTIAEDGTVPAVEVLGHVPADAAEVFDQVAMAAARTMTFHPALRDGTPMAVRLRYHMVIAPPVVPMDAGTTAEVDELGTGSEGVAHAHTHADAAVTDQGPDASVTDAGAGTDIDAGATEDPLAGEATIRAHNPPAPRAASDIYTTIGVGLRQVPRANASGILNLAAPGILLTNEGGEGHAEQVYLRGFDAHEGQDLEFTVEGVPVNEPGNAHGEGLANTHFIIPELVSAVRVLEGPFDPHQGNYAVAGSVDYELGLDERGLTMQYTGGSFNTQRLLALWAPDEGHGERGTFAGVDLRTTDGFGANRSARYGRAMAQYELRLSDTTTLRLLATTYATEYGSAGVIREDDYAAGRVSFYGTYDPTQGGDEARHSVSVTLEDRRPGSVARQQVFAILHNSRIRDDYTGFVLDTPAPWRSGNAQRGDEVDQETSGVSVGGRGSLRLSGALGGLQQAIEAGYYGRYDAVDASQKRLRFGTVIPYRTDLNLSDAITNVGLYIDSELRLTRWLTLRGGVRGDYFSYDVLNNCDLHDTSLGSGITPLDTQCYGVDRTGPRDPTARRSASGMAFEPRGTLLVGPFHDLTFVASAGTGARAADPAYLGDGNQAPFASILSGEAGAVYHRVWRTTALVLRGLYYYTYVNRDLIFNEQEGRNTLAPGTQRQGFVAAVRLTAPWVDWAASVTYADARFVRTAMDPGATYFPPDQGDMVPYVPSWVARSDVGIHGRLPWLHLRGDTFMGRVGVGMTYVSPRSLPYGEWSDPMFVVDASASVRWRWIEVGVIAENLFDTQYRLGEYNYVSNFNPGTSTPDMVAGRLFTAGPPLGVFGTLTLYLGETAARGGS